MRLGKINPTLLFIKEELNRLLRILEKMDMPSYGRSSVPADIWLSEEDVIVRFEIPGGDPRSLSLAGHTTFLEISGTKSTHAPPDGAKYLIAERIVGPFRRAVELPAPVDMNRIQATFANGLMTVTLMRIDERRGHRKKIAFTVET